MLKLMRVCHCEAFPILMEYLQMAFYYRSKDFKYPVQTGEENQVGREENNNYWVAGMCHALSIYFFNSLNNGIKSLR